MKKLSLVTLLLCLCACGSSNEKEVEGTMTNSKGEVATAKLKLDGEEIKEVELDESYKETTKKTLGAEYNMKQASTIGKEWNEQVDYLEKYIEKNGIAGITLDDEGKASNEDVRSGCTISIDNFLKAIEQAKANANQE